MQLRTLPNFYFTVSNAIDTIAKKQGQVIVSKDERKLFIDLDTSTRIPISDVIHIQNADMLPLSPLDKVYVDDERKDMYLYIGDDWVRYTCQDNTTIKLTKDNALYQPNVIDLGNGLDVEEDPYGNTILSVSLQDYELQFTASDIDKGGILTVTNARVGSFFIIDDTGKLTVPAMTQVGDNVQVNLYDWEVNGTWKIFFPQGAAASTESINSIVDAIMTPAYVNSELTAPIVDVEAHQVYNFTSPLVSLELDDIEFSHKKSEVRFVAGTGFTFKYATGAGKVVGLIGSVPVFTTGKAYHIYIRDSYMEIKEVTLFS